MNYTEEPWNPVWDYKLNWSGEFTESYMIKEAKMTEDEKDFEEEFKKAGGHNLNEPIDITASIYLWARWGFLAGRRTLRRKESQEENPYLLHGDELKRTAEQLHKK
jgi:hypothetical protein